jgi:hypothetical protein
LPGALLCTGAAEVCGALVAKLAAGRLVAGDCEWKTTALSFTHRAAHHKGGISRLPDARLLIGASFIARARGFRALAGNVKLLKSACTCTSASALPVAPSARLILRRLCLRGWRRGGGCARWRSWIRRIACRRFCGSWIAFRGSGWIAGGGQGGKGSDAQGHGDVVGLASGEFKILRGAVKSQFGRFGMIRAYWKTVQFIPSVLVGPRKPFLSRLRVCDREAGAGNRSSIRSVYCARQGDARYRLLLLLLRGLLRSLLPPASCHWQPNGSDQRRYAR